MCVSLFLGLFRDMFSVLDRLGYLDACCVIYAILTEEGREVE